MRSLTGFCRDSFIGKHGNFDDLECRDPLHAGRAEYPCCFIALHFGLQTWYKTCKQFEFYS
jgi:hypothetical protein